MNIFIEPLIAFGKNFIENFFSSVYQINWSTIFFLGCVVSDLGFRVTGITERVWWCPIFFFDGTLCRTLVSSLKIQQ